MQNTQTAEAPATGMPHTDWPRSMHNPLHPRNLSATPEQSWRYDATWIYEADTYACEWFNGVHAAFVTNGGTQRDYGIYTKKDSIDPHTRPDMWLAVMRALKAGRIKSHPEITSVMQPGTFVNCGGELRFVSRQEQMARMRYTLWDGGDHSFDSVQALLLNCTDTHDRRWASPLSGSRHDHKVWRTEDGEPHKVHAMKRPDGMMFFNERLALYGKVRVEDCRWWQILHGTYEDHAKQGEQYKAETEYLENLKYA